MQDVLAVNTVLQAGRSRVRLSMVYLEYFDIVLRATLWVSDWLCL